MAQDADGGESVVEFPRLFEAGRDDLPFRIVDVSPFSGPFDGIERRRAQGSRAGLLPGGGTECQEGHRDERRKTQTTPPDHGSLLVRAGCSDRLRCAVYCIRCSSIILQIPPDYEFRGGERGRGGDNAVRAMVIEAFGGPERLKAAEVPTPVAGDEEVLIALACTSVNPVDWKIGEGMLADMFPHSFPLIPGWDAAGTVSAVGRNADRFKTGDKVFAYCRKPQIQFGTYCEYVAVHESAVALMPGNLGFAEAATVPLTGLTAWQSLFDTAKLSGGEKILIHAGSGGVGSLAIQLAKHAGATVYTTARAVNHDYVRSLGADVAIDYAKENFVDVLRKREPGGIDVVYDTIGGHVQQRSYR